MKRLFLPFALGALLLSSCGDPQKTSLQVLQEKDYEFTVGDYVKAAARGDLEAVKLFRNAGMALGVSDAQGRTALLVASEAGRGSTVQHLVEEGAEVLQRGEGGAGPLLLAARSGSVEAVQALLAGGADPKAEDDSAWTPIAAASYEGYPAIVELLAPVSGAHLDRALHLASVKGDTKVVDVLLNEGASLYTRSGEGKTALMYAASNGKMDVVQLLLARGANPVALDNENRTAADIAAIAGHQTVSDLLNAPPEPGSPHPALDVEDAYAVLAEAEGHDPMQAVEGVYPADPSDPRATTGPLGPTIAAHSAQELAASPERITAPAQRNPQPSSASSRPAPEPVKASAASTASTASARRQAARRTNGNAPQSAPAASVNTAPLRVGGPVPTSITGSGNATTVVPSVPFEPNGAAAAGTPVAQTRSKLPVRIQGRVLAPSLAVTPERTMQNHVQMLDYRESMLPVMLNDVQGQQAEIRMLFGDRTPFVVEAGSPIPHTPLEVVSVERRIGHSKQGKGEPVNVSRMIVEDRSNGERHMILRDTPAMSSSTYAVIRFEGDGENEVFYDAREGDEFAADNGTEPYRIVGVRPNQVVIEKVATGEVYTIPRVTYRGQ